MQPGVMAVLAEATSVTAAQVDDQGHGDEKAAERVLTDLQLEDSWRCRHIWKRASSQISLESSSH